MGQSILKEKSYRFALSIVKLCRSLQEDKKEYVISRQLLRSGTAVGAMIREAEFAESRADFAHKMSIALKEANETKYWLSLLRHSGYDVKPELETECSELIAMLVASTKTVKPRRN